MYYKNHLYVKRSTQTVAGTMVERSLRPDALMRGTQIADRAYVLIGQRAGFHEILKPGKLGPHIGGRFFHGQNGSTSRK